MKKFLLVLIMFLIITGCKSEANTVTINIYDDEKNRIEEKKDTDVIDDPEVKEKSELSPEEGKVNNFKEKAKSAYDGAKDWLKENTDELKENAKEIIEEDKETISDTIDKVKTWYDNSKVVNEAKESLNNDKENIKDLFNKLKNNE